MLTDAPSTQSTGADLLVDLILRGINLVTDDLDAVQTTFVGTWHDKRDRVAVTASDQSLRVLITSGILCSSWRVRLARPYEAAA